MLGENMRIGILTEYYESSNYGGNLQAYALTRYINDHYGKTEQIQYKRNIPPQNGGKQLLNKSFQEILIKIFVKSRDLIIGRIIKNKIQARIKLRNESIKNFNFSIPHSKVVYSDDTINRSIEDYDCFVVGSDQVWRTFYNRAYFLGFVPENKLKISYAASISRNTLTDNEQAILRETLPGFTGISVREKEAVELVKNATGISSEWVLDPVFLLGENHWNEICDNRQVSEPYVFCYFLGDSTEHRHLVKKFARLKHCKIVTLPYMLGQYRYCDLGFGDDQRYSCSPNEFLSLIRYAEYIITDSFHAVVFSHIFKKQFFVFERNAGHSMSSRLRSILEIIEAEDRFCKNNKKDLSIDHLVGMDEITYDKELPLLAAMKEKSIKFLEKYLMNPAEG